MTLEQLIALGLTPEQAAATVALHDTDVTGLKSKADELLGKLATSKTESDAQIQAAADAKQVAADAVEAKLKADSDMEGLKAFYLKQAEENTANATAASQINEKKWRDVVLERDMGEVYHAILGKVSENLRPAAKALLAGCTDISYAEDGKVQKSIKIGDKVYASESLFLEAALLDPTWKSLIEAPSTQGQGASNNGNNGQAAGNLSHAQILYPTK